MSAPQRPTKTVVVAGAPNVGKATLIGNLMYKCGYIDLIKLQELQRAGVDRYDQMVRYYRKQGLQLRFETKHADIVIQEKAIAGSEPDCVVLLDVADGTPSLAELPAGDLRGKQVVYVVNKMESVAWSEDRYRQAVDAMRGALDESAKHAIGVPISALHSDNILEPSINSPWLAQDSASPRTLLDAIDLAVMA